MPAYHSTFNAEQVPQVCGCALLPIKTKLKGPAPVQKDDSKEDIIDETLNFFKANMLFRNFEVKGPADRVLIYLTFYAHQALTIAAKCLNKGDADKQLYQLAQQQFKIPGEGGFALGGYFPSPKNRQEEDQFRAYFKQVREELGLRLTERVFKNTPDGKPDKFWVQFTKRKFLNKVLTN